MNEAINAYDKYKMNHMQRLNTMKEMIRHHAQFDLKNEKVEHEVQLLKKVREATK